MNNKLCLLRRRIMQVLSAAFVAIWFIGLALNAQAQDGWQRDGAAKTKQTNAASSGDFAVLQVATTEPDKLMADWAKSTPGVSVTQSTGMIRNQPIVTFIIFKGCRADVAGNCNVTVDYNTTAPDGKAYDNTKGAEVWVGHPPAPNLNLQLSVSGYGLRIEEKDPLGVYRVRATVTDHVTGVTLKTEQSLTAVEK